MLEPDALRGVQMLAAVADQGSFTAAARVLGLTPSGVSKAVARLEEQHGVQLVRRTTRSLSLTEVGARYLARCRPVLAELAAATAELEDTQSTFAGTLRVTAPSVLGREVVGPCALAFLARWPEVSIETRFLDAYVDLAAERFDLAVRVARQLPDSSLVGRQVIDYTSVLVASPAYLARRGTPRSPEALDEHDGLMLRTSAVEATWPTVHGDVRPRMRLLSGDIRELHQAALHGLGIATIPGPWVREDLASGRLVEVLPGTLELHRQVWLLRPHRRYTPRLVEVFADALTAALERPVPHPFPGNADTLHAVRTVSE